MVKPSAQADHSYPNTNVYLLSPQVLETSLFTANFSRKNSMRSNYSFRSNYSGNSAPSEYQCSDPHQILRFGQNLPMVLHVLKGSTFLAVLLAVFAFFVATVLGSVLLMIFSIWL